MKGILTLRIKILFSLILFFVVGNIALAIHEYSIRKNLFGIYINKYEIYYKNNTDIISNKYKHNFPSHNTIENNNKFISARDNHIIKYLLENKYKAKSISFSSNKNDNDNWLLENETFLVPDRLNNFQFTPFLQPKNYDSSYADRKQNRVLVVGDSFLFGNGLVDINRTVSNRFKYLLSEEYDSNFNFFTFAKPNSSIIDYKDWLTYENIKYVNPDFITIFLFENDLEVCDLKITLFCRTKIIKEISYQNCLSGKLDIYTKLLRKILFIYPATYDKVITIYCNNKNLTFSNIDSSKLLIANPNYNPGLSSIKNALEIIKKNSMDIPVYVIFMNDSCTRFISKGCNFMPDKEANFIYSRAYPELFKEYGFIVSEPRHYKNYKQLLSLTKEKLCSNPADCHFSTKVADFYAKTALNTIKESNFSPKFIYKFENDLLLSKSPSYIPIINNSDHLLIGNLNPVIINQESEKYFSYQNIDITKYLRFKNNKGDKFYSFSPCSSIGRPHIRVSFDNQVAKGKKIRIELLNAEFGSVAFSTFGYDENEFEVIDELKMISINEIIEYDFSNNRSGIIIASHKSGCPIDKTILAPEMLLKVSII